MSQMEHQMRARDKEMVPRILVRAMFGLMAASLAIVAYAQWTDAPQRGVLLVAPVEAERTIVFRPLDRQSNYGIFELDGTPIAMSSDERAGFIGVMGKVLDRTRLLHGVDPQTPVRVVRRSNGNIAIIDDATDWSVDLIGYGVDNVAAFGSLLD